MLSFITLSREEHKVAALEDNLAEVFGKPKSPHCIQDWELLPIDGTKYDLFQGYNEGARQAEGRTLVFLHDDVRLLCNARVLEVPLALLKKPFTGFVGVAGTARLEKEATWWQSSPTFLCGAVHHPGLGPFGMHLNTWRPQVAQFGKVVALDGVFLMIEKAKFEELKGFDNLHYSGFHFYDIDITLRAHLRGLANYAAPIPLFHRSPGATPEEWEKNRQLFLKLHGSHLPARV
jgi:hypothetical protein